MSEAAKERVIFLGTQFNKVEHQPPLREGQTVGSPKKSFWKRNTNKFPGSVKPAFVNQEQSHSQNLAGAGSVAGHVPGKVKVSRQQSFEDFEGKTSDAWEDSDDDCIKIDNNAAVPSGARVRTISGGEVRAAIAAQTDKKQTEPKQVAATKKEEKPSRPSPLSLLTRNRNQSNPKPVPQGHSQKQSQPVHSPKPPSPIRSIKLEFQDQEVHKLEKFGKLLAGPNTDIEAVRKLSWSGIPVAVRPISWQLLLSYLPANIDRRQATLDRKRDEYHRYVKQYYHTRHDDIHQDTFRQIHIDIPRTNPLIPLFQQPKVQEIFERILYIWAMRHPASGYVQGINDLVTPFFVVFLSGYVDGDLENYDITTVPQETLDIVEADTFWGVSKLLDGIQDNYTFAQPGIQTKVNALRELVHRIDTPLHQHLERHHVEYLQFSFRWMNNLLMREMPLRCTIRLWDTYLAEESGFAAFHLYVCTALLVHFSKDVLRENDFQGLMLLLQNLPTVNWGDQEIGLLLAEAFRLKYMFADAPKHLQGKS